MHKWVTMADFDCDAFADLYDPIGGRMVERPDSVVSLAIGRAAVLTKCVDTRSKVTSKPPSMDSVIEHVIPVQYSSWMVAVKYQVLLQVKGKPLQFAAVAQITFTPELKIAETVSYYYGSDSDRFKPEIQRFVANAKAWALYASADCKEWAALFNKDGQANEPPLAFSHKHQTRASSNTPATLTAQCQALQPFVQYVWVDDVYVQKIDDAKDLEHYEAAVEFNAVIVDPKEKQQDTTTTPRAPKSITTIIGFVVFDRNGLIVSTRDFFELPEPPGHGKNHGGNHPHISLGHPHVASPLFAFISAAVFCIVT